MTAVTHVCLRWNSQHNDLAEIISISPILILAGAHHFNLAQSETPSCRLTAQ